MTRQFLKPAVAVALILAMPAVMSPVWATDSTASVMGRVLGEDTRTPVTGAVVKIRANEGDGDVVASQPTTADGSFRIADLEPGDYAVTVETASGAYKVSDALALEADTTRLIQMSLRKDAAAAASGGGGGGGGGAAAGGSGGSGGSNAAPLIGFAILIVVGLLASRSDDTPPSGSGGSVSPSVPGN